MRLLSGFIAVSLGIVTYVVLGAYAYPTMPGIMYLAGNFLGSFLLLALAAAIIAKVRKRRIRYDVVLWLMPFVVLAANYGRLIAVYDTRTFMAELAAAGPGKHAEDLRTSETNFAAYGPDRQRHQRDVYRQDRRVDQDA